MSAPIYSTSLCTKSYEEDCNPMMGHCMKAAPTFLGEPLHDFELGKSAAQ
jgi:hypothetical protein